MKRSIFSLGIIAIILCGLALTNSPYTKFPETAPGTLTFIGNAGSDQVFKVDRWKFSKIENIDAPENIQIEAELDITSLSGGWDDLLKSIKKKKDYFHVSKYKVASAKVNGAKAKGDGTYEADVILTLKGVTKKVPMTFTISGEGPYRLEAEGVVKRRKFGFNGGGPKNEVPVKISADLVLPE